MIGFTSDLLDLEELPEGFGQMSENMPMYVNAPNEIPYLPTSMPPQILSLFRDIAKPSESWFDVLRKLGQQCKVVGASEDAEAVARFSDGRVES